LKGDMKGEGRRMKGEGAKRTMIGSFLIQHSQFNIHTLAARNLAISPSPFAPFAL